MFVGRSTDLGETWATTMVRDNRAFSNPKERDRPISGLAVDHRTGKDDVVAVSWRWDPVGLESPNAAPIAPMISVSTDGARTFSQAVNPGGRRLRPGGPPSRCTEARPDHGCAAIADHHLSGRGHHHHASPCRVEGGAAQPGRNFGGSNPSVAIDAKGTIYAAWVSTFGQHLSGAAFRSFPVEVDRQGQDLDRHPDQPIQSKQDQRVQRPAPGL